jgi:tetratricopeptide (TPR) repeat protein
MNRLWTRALVTAITLVWASPLLCHAGRAEKDTAARAASARAERRAKRSEEQRPDGDNAPAKQEVRRVAVRIYNEGVPLLRDREYAAAQRKFERAADIYAQLAEAHSNLGYAMQMQGPQNYNRAANSYTKALRHNPKLPEAYYGRGALYVQMGQLGRAKEDVANLHDLRSPLARELEYLIANNKERNPEKLLAVCKEIRDPNDSESEEGW